MRLTGKSPTKSYPFDHSPRVIRVFNGPIFAAFHEPVLREQLADQELCVRQEGSAVRPEVPDQLIGVTCAE